jgi:hypothetical protein
VPPSPSRPPHETIVLGLGGSRTLVAAVTDTVERLRGVYASGARGVHMLTVCRHGFSVGAELPAHNQRVEPGAEREYYSCIEACVPHTSTVFPHLSQHVLATHLASARSCIRGRLCCALCVHTHTHTHTHSHSHTHSLIHTLIHPQRHTHTHSHSLTHSDALTHTHSFAYSHAHTILL